MNRNWCCLILVAALTASTASRSMASDAAARCAQLGDGAKQGLLQCLTKCDARASRSPQFNAARCHQACGARFRAQLDRINKLAMCTVSLPPGAIGAELLPERDITGVLSIDGNGGDDLFDPNDLDDAGCITVDGVGAEFDCDPYPPGGGPGPGLPPPGSCPAGDIMVGGTCVFLPPPNCVPPAVSVNGTCIVCEVGIVDPAGHCCASGVIDQVGNCCAPGEIVGRNGLCWSLRLLEPTCGTSCTFLP